jgi:hypothetical protein
MQQLSGCRPALERMRSWQRATAASEQAALGDAYGLPLGGHRKLPDAVQRPLAKTYTQMVSDVERSSERSVGWSTGG